MIADPKMIRDNIFIQPEDEELNEVEEQDERIDPEGRIVEQAGLIVFAHSEPRQDDARDDDVGKRDEQGRERVELLPSLDETKVEEEQDLRRQCNPTKTAALRHIATQHGGEEIEEQRGGKEDIDVEDNMVLVQIGEELVVVTQGLGDIVQHQDRDHDAETKIVQPPTAYESQ